MPEDGTSSRNRMIAIVGGVLVIIIILVVILLLRDDDSSTTKTTTDAQGQNATPNSPAQQSSSATEKVVMTFKKGQTCHTKKLAGGNSDALFEFEINVPDGTKVKVTFKSNKQTTPLVSEGVVKGKKLLVRAPVVAIGEELTLSGVDVPGQTLTPADVQGQPAAPAPLHKVPDKSDPGPTNKCDLDDPETAANGTINQPNAANAAANAN